jgi:cytochrome c553
MFVAGLLLPACAALAQELPPPEIAAKVALCATCHGEDGLPTVANAPIIHGQHAYYLMLQLRDYRAERRSHEIMTPMAQELSDSDIQSLAAYFASLPWPAYREAAGNEAFAKAQALEVEGQCPQCHLGAYLGNSDVPHIGHQKADYLDTTMRAYRDGSRANSPAMTALVEGWSDEEIAAMAAYLAGL